jgi:acetolactate synthase-1/2/3 large subunit
MNGADILVKSLEDLQVKWVSGYPGAAILPVFHSLGASSIEVMVSSNEQSCAFCAAGVSRAGDQVGVAVVTSGPAITNTLTAVADSNADSIPLLVFAGQVPSGKLGTDEFQHIDVSRVFARAAKKVILVSETCKIEEIVKDAYYFARSGKPGPVVIDLPMDAQLSPGEYAGLAPEIFRQKYEDERHLGDEQCKMFYAMLAESKRPLLYIGGGLNNQAASDRIREFNRLFNIPSINSLMGKGILDESLDTSLGMLGMYGTPYANKAIQETDLFVGMGVRWDDRVAQKVGESGLEADIAYIDINPEKVQEVRVSRRPRFSFIGDAGTALRDLLAYARKNPVRLEISAWQQRVQTLKKQITLGYNRETSVIQQAGVIDLLSELLPEDMRITTGVGNHQMLAAQYFKIKKPKSFLTSGGFGTMGFALPCAIGAHFADPSTRVLAIDGDGSLRMNMGELHTIGTRGLPIKVLLLNNRSSGMVRNIQSSRYGGRIVATEESSREVSFANIARECGFQTALKVEHYSDLRPALETLLSSEGPAFLEVVTDITEEVFPKIAPGDGYKDMDLGPFIKDTGSAVNREKP